MRTVEGTLGNVREDDDLAAALERHEAAGTLERVEIDAADRVKSRLRVRTDAGTDLGIVADRPVLRDGDVLAVDEADEGGADDRMFVVRFASREAVAIELPTGGSPDALLEVGHRIGNQHWDLAVRDGTAYVPLDADLRIVEDVLDDALPAGATTNVETVDGSLFVEDGRDGVDGHEIDHAHHGEAEHAHRGDHDHSHDGSGHEHTHHDGGERT